MANRLKQLVKYEDENEKLQVLLKDKDDKIAELSK
mgnify:FL=1